ncbi:MAG: hypothetical protein ACTSR8_12640 [Promethearchaeota archaeon]
MSEVITNLRKFLDFIYIYSENEAIFMWKPPQSFQSFLLDMNIVRENPATDVFFHMDKGNRKIAYIRKKNRIIYAIGADNIIQFQILEALLEAILEKFLEIYDVDVILSYGNVSTTPFKGFSLEVDEIIANFKTLNLVKKVDIQCKVCNAMLPLYLKRSFVENADSYPVSIVYKHSGHATLCFIDKNYGVRGVELVSMTG